MASYRIGFIGTGKKGNPGLKGYAMAYQHALGYKLLPDCEIAACADIVRENAEAFAKEFGVKGVYTDYNEMLKKEKPDVVSIATWPHLHAEMIIACCNAGVKAIHSEKPVATTWGDAKKSVAAAEKAKVQLTFNHQRRFGRPFRLAKEKLREGAIGKLQRMEFGLGDIYDGGTHWVDMMNMFNDETPAEWVIGQIDMRQIRLAFGAPIEWQGIFHVMYKNGVQGVFFTGVEIGDKLGFNTRLYGTEGIIELGWDSLPGWIVRWLRYDKGTWTGDLANGESLHGPNFVERAIADTIESLRIGREPELSARRAMNATEIIFACYESSRRRARIDLPLTIDDSPIQSMMDKGEVKWEYAPNAK